MKISELIDVLAEAKEQHGDIEVVVKYRDSSGEYTGYDTDVYADIQNNLQYVIFYKEVEHEKHGLIDVLNYKNLDIAFVL